MMTPNTILVATDFSRPSDAALTYGRALARNCKATLHVLHTPAGSGSTSWSPVRTERGGVAHLLMGSVAERIVRTAPCPVLTVRHPEHEFFIPDAVAAVVKA